MFVAVAQERSRLNRTGDYDRAGLSGRVVRCIYKQELASFRPRVPESNQLSAVIIVVLAWAAVSALA
jgi:hypothetical protein